MIFVFIFKNNEWIEQVDLTDYLEDFDNLVYKISYSFPAKECYYFGGKLHRIDGPAVTSKFSEKPDDYFDEWYIEGNRITNFHPHIYEIENMTKELFAYVKIYPQHLEDVVLLARHNNWLTEDQISVLLTTYLFL